MSSKIKNWTVGLAYCLTIPAANWLIGHVGTPAFPGGPHLIKVGFGYSAPSGVLMIGVALVLRDYLQQRAGKAVALVAMCAGVVLSYFINPDVAVASAVAFGVSELVDFAAYSTLARRRAVAVAVSGLAGAIVDSFLFLWLAFGSTTYWQGQVLAKAAVSVVVALLIAGRGAVSHRLHSAAA